MPTFERWSVRCLAVGFSFMLAAAAADAQRPGGSTNDPSSDEPSRGPVVRPSGVTVQMQLLASPDAAGEYHPSVLLPAGQPKTRAEYDAGQLHWARIGLLVGAGAGLAAAAISVKGQRSGWRNPAPLMRPLVFVLGLLGGEIMGTAAYIVSHRMPDDGMGRRPPRIPRRADREPPIAPATQPPPP